MRLAALVTHPIQYFAPLFRAVAALPDVDLTVYFCSRHGLDEKRDDGFGATFKWDVPLLDGYRSRFLPGLQLNGEPGGFARPFNPGIARELRRGRYDAVWVHGHFSATNWLAMLAARTAGVKVLLRSESNLVSQRPAAGAEALRRLGLRSILGLADGCLYIGRRNRDYYRTYGVPDDRLFSAPYVVDNAHFRDAYRRLGPERAAIRSSFDIAGGRPVILFVGKLIPKKQPLLLLEAFAEVRRRHDCALLFAGDGAMRPALEREIARRGIPDAHLTGFLNQSEVVRAYAAGDLIVLPSSREETWGLVINEAMNFALPALVSSAVGCADDLVHDGQNGYVFQPDSCAELAAGLAALVADGEKRRAFGRRSLELIEEWGLEQCALGIVQAARKVTQGVV
jgi:glycosyltransferase involved in cell wall biosynthesis